MLRCTPHIILLFTLLACTACEDLISPKEDKLPPITTEGKNTFGCLVNGEVWLPRAGGGQPKLNNFFSDDGTFNLIAIKGTSGVVNFGIRNCCDSINYLLVGSPHSTVLFGDENCNYFTDSTYTGTFEILKYDRSKFIVAGLFEFTVYEPGCDTIKVTDGRFDIKYR